jgi:DNA-binding IclR family transcriptional regulator
MPGPVQSIERAAAVLRLLAGQRSLALVEMSTALDLANGTTHGILTTLKSVGFVEQDRASGRYRLGEGLLRLSNAGIDPNELRSRATNLADSLAARSGHAVRIAILQDSKVQTVHHVFRPDNSDQVLDIGSFLPGHATALGKTLLAFDLSAHPVDVGGPEQTYTRRTITDPVLLRRALAEVRARGWADEIEERVPGEASVAAPLRVQGGLVVGAIGVSGRADRLCGPPGQVRPELVALVCDTARAVSRELGNLR